MTDKKAVVDAWIRGIRLHRKMVENTVGKQGIHQAQHRLLMHLAKREWNSQKELAEHMGVSTATMTVSLKKLERGGYIKRVMIPDDNRYNQLEITVKGREVVKESSDMFNEIDEKMLEGFSEQERKQFLEYLQRINSNLLEMLKKLKQKGK